METTLSRASSHLASSLGPYLNAPPAYIAKLVGEELSWVDRDSVQALTDEAFHSLKIYNQMAQAHFDWRIQQAYGLIGGASIKNVLDTRLKDIHLFGEQQVFEVVSALNEVVGGSLVLVEPPTIDKHLEAMLQAKRTQMSDEEWEKVWKYLQENGGVVTNPYPPKLVFEVTISALCRGGKGKWPTEADFPIGDLAEIKKQTGLAVDAIYSVLTRNGKEVVDFFREIARRSNERGIYIGDYVVGIISHLEDKMPVRKKFKRSDTVDKALLLKGLPPDIEKCQPAWKGLFSFLSKLSFQELGRTKVEAQVATNVLSFALGAEVAKHLSVDLRGKEQAKNDLLTVFNHLYSIEKKHLVKDLIWQQPLKCAKFIMQSLNRKSWDELVNCHVMVVPISRRCIQATAIDPQQYQRWLLLDRRIIDSNWQLMEEVLIKRCNADAFTNLKTLFEVMCTVRYQERWNKELPFATLEESQEKSGLPLNKFYEKVMEGMTQQEDFFHRVIQLAIENKKALSADFWEAALNVPKQRTAVYEASVNARRKRLEAIVSGCTTSETNPS